MFEKRKKLGLALGSGGPKGLAHIGIIKALEENGIPIDFIAGSSIGSLVGGLYAAKGKIFEVEKIVHDINLFQTLSIFIEPTVNQGLNSGQKLAKFIEKNIGDIDFKDLKIPFCAVTTDLKTSKTFLFDKGNVIAGIRASCAVPVFFKPVIDNNEHMLADGGLSAPVPVEIVRKMGADIIIAVNLYENCCENQEATSFKLSSIPGKAITILLNNLAAENIKKADIILNPKVGKVGWRTLLSQKAKFQTIDIGEETMREKLPQLKKMLFVPKENLLKRFFNFLFPAQET